MTLYTSPLRYVDVLAAVEFRIRRVFCRRRKFAEKYMAAAES